MKYRVAFVVIALLASVFYVLVFLRDIKHYLIATNVAATPSSQQSDYTPDTLQTGNVRNVSGEVTSLKAGEAETLHITTGLTGSSHADDGDPFSYTRLDRSKVLDLHCSQCALVSASGQLLNSGAGAEIDATPCVVRMNHSPTVKFEKDVGSRTTLRFLAHSAVPDVERHAATLLRGSEKPKYIVVWGPPKEMERSGNGRVFNYISKMQKEYPDIEFYMLENGQYEYAEHVFQIETGKSRYTSGSWLSTGLFTMVLLRKICDNIIIYGMVDSVYCAQNPRSNVPYHYFEPTGTKECSVYLLHEKSREHGHRFLTEKYIFESWALTRTYNITFRYPSLSLKTIDDLHKTAFLKT